jgi:hypothetical protein
MSPDTAGSGGMANAVEAEMIGQPHRQRETRRARCGTKSAAQMRPAKTSDSGVCVATLDARRT